MRVIENRISALLILQIVAIVFLVHVLIECQKLNAAINFLTFRISASNQK